MQARLIPYRASHDHHRRLHRFERFCDSTPRARLKRPMRSRPCVPMGVASATGDDGLIQSDPAKAAEIPRGRNVPVCMMVEPALVAVRSKPSWHDEVELFTWPHASANSTNQPISRAARHVSFCPTMGAPRACDRRPLRVPVESDAIARLPRALRTGRAQMGPRTWWMRLERVRRCRWPVRHVATQERPRRLAVSG